MSITFRITDGTHTLDFNDGTTLRLGAAFQQNTGGGSVTELVICGWVDSVTTDQKAAAMRDITQLIRKGVRHFRNRHIDRAVWLIWKPDTATNVQYAKVMGGGVVEVDTNTVGGRAGGVLQVEIVREGFWRSVAPNGGSGTSLASGTTIYNKSDADGDSWVALSARDTDAPGLLKITIDPAQRWQGVLVARRHGPFTSGAKSFNPWFNATDTLTSHTTNADTSAPADVRIELTASDSVLWNLSGADLEVYQGRYALYGWIKQISGAGTATAASSLGPNGVTANIGKARDVSSSIGRIYLGTVDIAPKYNPLITTTETYEIGTQVIITGTATVYVYGLWLVPIELPPLLVKADNSDNVDFAGATATDEFIIDGINQIVYETSGASDVWVTNTEVTVQGVYPVLEPNEATRLYFYFIDGDDHEFNDTYDIDVEVIDRFETLRGGV